MPYAQRSYVAREKITNYLLDVHHQRGGSKARFFVRFGFHLSEWETFAQALCDHGLRNEVIEIEETAFGMKYVVVGPIETPDGRNPNARTVWMVDRGTDFPRLVSARRER